MADLFNLAFAEAAELGHRWVGTEHLVLALLRPGEEPSPARDVLEASGMTHARYTRLVRGASVEAPPSASGGTEPDPAMYAAVGRAEGLALAFDDVPVKREHALLAVLWGRGLGPDVLDDAGVDRADVVARLAAAGVPVPAAPLPSRDRPPWGPPVPVPVAELPRVRDALLERLPPGTWGWNVDDDEQAWVAALDTDDAGPDMHRLVREILTE